MYVLTVQTNLDKVSSHRRGARPGPATAPGFSLPHSQTARRERCDTTRTRRRHGASAGDVAFVESLIMPRSAPSFQPRRQGGGPSIEDMRRGKERDRKRVLDQHRPSAHARGYDARWRRYRLTYLSEHPLCVHCFERGDVVPATDVDHKQPHGGDYDLFWDPDNHQALCKPCHSRKTATEDSAFARSENTG